MKIRIFEKLVSTTMGFRVFQLIKNFFLKVIVNQLKPPIVWEELSTEGHAKIWGGVGKFYIFSRVVVTVLCAYDCMYRTTH